VLREKRRLGGAGMHGRDPPRQEEGGVLGREVSGGGGGLEGRVEGGDEAGEGTGASRG